MFRKSHYTQNTTTPGLEYAAILSGLSMGGDFISDDDIKEARHVHTQRYGQPIGFVALPSNSTRR